MFIVGQQFVFLLSHVHWLQMCQQVMHRNRLERVASVIYVLKYN